MFLVFIIFMLMLTLCRDTFAVLQLVGYNSLLGKKKKEKKNPLLALFLYFIYILLYQLILSLCKCF